MNNYVLKDIPDDIWSNIKAISKREGISIRAIIVWTLKRNIYANTSMTLSGHDNQGDTEEDPPPKRYPPKPEPGEGDRRPNDPF